MVRTQHNLCNVVTFQTLIPIEIARKYGLDLRANVIVEEMQKGILLEKRTKEQMSSL
jgi:bifunctional DNA-binding transcriptional regulator/antitoxin component of YhaV-PrlF toxin-antitoxin module